VDPQPRFSIFASDVDIARLFEGNLALVLASFLGFGLLLAFTPCVLPMVPILSGIIVGEGRGVGKLRALSLSIAYVLGMAVAYAAAGVAAAYSGSLLAAALQNAWVLGAFALVFVWLALSMFGFYEIQMPAFLHHRLHAAHGRLKGGKLASVAAMGVLSAVIVSPCVAAPLAGALLYISQTRDVVLGGAALFTMALGMGVPLVAVGVSEGALLPKAGAWMKAVKGFFGVLLLVVALWIVSPVLPPAAVMAGWAALLVGSAMFLRALDPLPADAPGAARLAKGVGIMALVAGAALLVGALAGSRDPLRPLAGLAGGAAPAAPVKFTRVASLSELEARLAAPGRPVMLDFYADWCVSCKEMESFTFSDARVRAKMDGMILLQADVTANRDADKQLLKRFSLFGPPGIIFFDAEGREIRGLRVIGFQSADRFLKTLELATAP
jgi:thiol:disulfide interchange protein DsbD